MQKTNYLNTRAFNTPKGDVLVELIQDDKGYAARVTVTRPGNPVDVREVGRGYWRDRAADCYRQIVNKAQALHDAMIVQGVKN